ncbi:CPBP family intramembrane glutamic endopeptidase [Kordia sp.]|uniref:CPBP family intramembrane glutamic endopeptidase n=1 Tax=Kordia sp. TaxID=1965332 RepID=UPI003D2B4221
MFKNKNPFVSGIAMLVLISIIMLLPLDKVITEQYFTSFQIEYIVLSTKMFLIFLSGLLLVKKLEEQALSGISTKYKWAFKYLNLIPIYLFILGISTFINKDLSSINSYNLSLLLIACLFVGFAEEFVFRGYLQSVFIKKFIERKDGILIGVMFPAVFFGASHLLNLTVNDNIPQVIGQSIYAVCIGFFFGVILLKTNKLIPIAITHGLINFFFLFGSLPNLTDNKNGYSEPTAELTLTEQILSSATPILFFLPLLIIGYIILNKMNKNEILNKINH